MQMINTTAHIGRPEHFIKCRNERGECVLLVGRQIKKGGNFKVILSFERYSICAVIKRHAIEACLIMLDNALLTPVSTMQYRYPSFPNARYPLTGKI
jgi:hypothetical protein